MPRVAMYARVSTRGQDPTSQLDALRAYAAARGLDPVGEFVDHGVSGSKGRRPALDALVVACRRREVDAVAVVKLDRLARSVRHLTALAAELEALGVDLVVLDQGIDTSTPTGQLLFNVPGAIGQFELSLIRERTRAGLDAARRAGRHPGRPRALGARARAGLRRLRTAGRSIREIAEVLGCGRATVARELARAQRGSK